MCVEACFQTHNCTCSPVVFVCVRPALCTVFVNFQVRTVCVLNIVQSELVSDIMIFVLMSAHIHVYVQGKLFVHCV